MTIKFDTGIVFRKAKVCAKFHCPSSAVAFFSEDVGISSLFFSEDVGIHPSPVIESQKSPTNSSGTIVYNYPCYVGAEVKCP